MIVTVIKESKYVHTCLLAGVNDHIMSYLPNHLAPHYTTLCLSVCLPQGKPAGAPTSDTATAPHCHQRSKVDSTADPCKAKQRKKTEASLSYGSPTLNKTQLVGKKRTVAPGGLFRKSRSICRTFDQRARTPSSTATVTRARKVTVPQRTTIATVTTTTSSSSTLQKSRPADQGPSAIQADCGGATTTSHEGACMHDSYIT